MSGKKKKMWRTKIKYPILILEEILYVVNLLGTKSQILTS